MQLEGVNFGFLFDVKDSSERAWDFPLLSAAACCFETAV